MSTGCRTGAAIRCRAGRQRQPLPGCPERPRTQKELQKAAKLVVRQREHGLWRGEPASWADFDGRRSSSPTRPGVLGPATGCSDGVMHSTAQSDALWCGKTKVRLQHCSGICCCRTRLPVYNDFMHLH